MFLGLLILHVVLGLIIAPHGAQKLFGWFGGGGIQGTTGFFSMNFRNAREMAVLAGLAEFCGGVAMMLGLLTPFAALAIVVVMLNAIVTVHWKNGFFTSNGGFEFNLLIVAAALTLCGTSAGRYSLDHAFKIDDNLSGRWWVLGVAGGAVLIAAATLKLFWKGPQPAEAQA